MKKYRILPIVIALLLTLSIALSACIPKPSGGGTGGGGTPIDPPPIDPPSTDTPYDPTGLGADFEEILNEAKTAVGAPDATDLDTDWESESYTTIVLSDTNGITVTPTKNAKISGSTVTISTAGTYVVSGTISDGRIVTDKAVDIRLVLNGAHITSTTSAPISFMKKADKRVLTLAAGTENSLTDASVYTVFDDDEGTEPNGTLFSKRALTINGSGKLTVTGNNNNGISCKGDLKILGCEVVVTSTNNAVKGNDSVFISNSSIDVVSTGNSIRSDTEDAAGYVRIENSTIKIRSAKDAIEANKLLYITGGSFDIVTGGGADYNNGDPTLPSQKALKSGGNIVIEGADITIDACDDAVNATGKVLFFSGSITAKTGDDAIHADIFIGIAGGMVDILSSKEGFEALKIEIKGGDISIVSADDGVNSSAGDGVHTGAFNPDCLILVSGGNLLVNAGGDGIDSNGIIVITGGTVTVYGTTRQGDSAIDSDGGIFVCGGTLVAGGSYGMVEVPQNNSPQNILVLSFAARQNENTVVTIKNADGEIILNYAPQKSFWTIIYSSAALTAGNTYTVYSGETLMGEFTVTERITTVNYGV
ncbi:MAG: carbohydrate-binding domain-containing protein [Clostridiales bacterium]|jgi:hypothetical protein|nr:carbohydrate-binding domain-containing protein [Clostridiales bacterium]